MAALTEPLKRLLERLTANATFGPRTSAVILLGVGLIALTALLASVNVNVAPLGVSLTAAVGALGLLAVAGGLVFAVLPERRPVIAVDVEAPGGTVLLGMDVSQAYITYGVLRVSTEDRKSLPTDRYVSRSGMQRIDIAAGSDDHVAHVARAIVETCKTEQELSGIGLALTGQIDPLGKRMANPWGPFQFQERFVDSVIAAIPESDQPLVMRSLNLPANRGTDGMNDKVLIDNNVRCAARSVLSRRGEEGRWRNLALLDVDVMGVGSALVLDGRLYYGTSQTAGELGHMTVHLDERVPAGDPKRTSTSVDACQCGKEGVHFETLVSAHGLNCLARSVDPARYGELVAAFTDEGDQRTELTPGEVLRACLLAEHRPVTPEMNLPDLPTEPALSTDVTSYLRDIMRRYAYFLAVGVADVLNLLNLDHVLMGGQVMRALWPLRVLRDTFDATLARYALSEPNRAANFVDATDVWAWPGAALLWRDPSYELMLRSAARAN